ncbi:MAG: hypothetical protein PVJ66_09440 [Gammaproteobacteria bacterium]|jgi:hypothetical protein
MSGQSSDTGNSDLRPASTTTVSDASLDKFARVFEASARRWEVFAYPSLLAFIVLAAYGFYLIYSMTSDVHRLTEPMDSIVYSMVVVSYNMIRVTDIMTSMPSNMNTMTQEVVHTGRSLDEGLDVAKRMDHKFAVMVPIGQRMQVDADVMTRRMHDVTRPMNFMSNMIPMRD